MHLGLIIPSSNTVMEEELSKYVVVHSTRISLKNVDENSLKKMNAELVNAVSLISDCNPDVIIYGCTSGSFIDNVEKILKKSPIPALTTSQAVISALQTLKAQKISVATPYIDEINQKEKAFLESKGFTIKDIKGLGLLNNREIGRQPPEVAYNLVKSLKKADVTFISCTNFRTFDIIHDLENELNTPVISSNSASLWNALKLTHTKDIKEKIYLGTLLEEFL
jgi:maleate isomerase